MQFNWKRFLLLACIALPIVTLISEKPYFTSAEDDLEDDVDIDDHDHGGPEETPTETLQDDGEAEPVTGMGKSEDAETTILFFKPTPGLAGASGPELHSGKLVEFLVGFVNKGSVGFTLEHLDASFRYPMDYSFHIQNFTSSTYNKLVKPKEQTTLHYRFYVDESFAGRPFGLIVNLAYRDAEGKPYMDAVYNQTVTVVEFEEGLDGETFFLYIFLAALIVLLLVVGQHVLTSFSKKTSSRKQTIERGTGQSDDVDFEWLPKETLREISRNASPKQSPRQRKAGK